MKINDWLSQATKKLVAAGVESARLDALLLVGDELGKSKAWILAHDQDEITPDKIAILGEKLARRSTHEPLAYIRQTVEFYGRTFAISPDVLVPRPESESIISLLNSVVQYCDQPLRITDIGTGSGCLAITAKKEHPSAAVQAVDISAAALRVARQNAKTHNVEIEFLESDLLSAIEQPLHTPGSWIFLANLPYVPEDYPTSLSTAHEPFVALFSEQNGLAHYDKLFMQAARYPTPPDFIITESLYSQHEALVEIAHKNNYHLVQSQDLCQVYRYA